MRSAYWSSLFVVRTRRGGEASLGNSSQEGKGHTSRGERVGAMVEGQSSLSRNNASCCILGNTLFVKLGVEISDAVVDAEDVLEFGGEGAGDGAARGGTVSSRFGPQAQKRTVKETRRVGHGLATYDWGRRPLGFQSFSRSSSVTKSTRGAPLAGWVGVVVGEVAICAAGSLVDTGLDRVCGVCMGDVRDGWVCKIRSGCVAVGKGQAERSRGARRERGCESCQRLSWERRNGRGREGLMPGAARAKIGYMRGG